MKEDKVLDDSCSDYFKQLNDEATAGLDRVLCAMRSEKVTIQDRINSKLKNKKNRK
jgi:hypothetical protein